MKYIILILSIFLVSCDMGKDTKEYRYSGEITSLRIDDDGEYHFSTDNLVEHDVYKMRVDIERDNTNFPQLLKVFIITNFKDGRQREHESYGDYKIVLPYNYKIETFDD
jgi:hypothetical protein